MKPLYYPPSIYLKPEPVYFSVGDTLVTVTNNREMYLLMLLRTLQSPIPRRSKEIPPCAPLSLFRSCYWGDTPETSDFWAYDGLSRRILTDPKLPLPSVSRKDLKEFKSLLRRLNLLP